MPQAIKKPDLSLEGIGRVSILTCKARRAPSGGKVPQGEAQLTNARAREYRLFSRVARTKVRRTLWSVKNSVRVYRQLLPSRCTPHPQPQCVLTLPVRSIRPFGLGDRPPGSGPGPRKSRPPKTSRHMQINLDNSAASTILLTERTVTAHDRLYT